MKRKGQSTGFGFDSFLDVGIIIVAVVFLAGVGAYALNWTSLVAAQPVTVDNETFNATSDPYNHTVTKASESLFVEVMTATCYQSTAQSTEVTTEIIDAEDGVVELSGVTVDAGDESCTYEYDEKTQSVVNIVGTGVNSLDQLASVTGLMIVIALLLLVVGVFVVVRRRGSGASAV